jgi:hypothetical protein
MQRGRSHREAGAAAPRRRRLAFSFAALLAVFLQAFVVQTHVHAYTAPVSARFELPAHAAHDSSEQVSADSHQTICVVCQALATAGAATLTSATTLAAVEHVTEAALLALSLAPQLHSHSWQSRAPPSFL